MSGAFHVTSIFDSASDALAYYRFTEIPRILSDESVDTKEYVFGNAEDYLKNWNELVVRRIHKVLEMIDDAIKMNKTDKDTLTLISHVYNEIIGRISGESYILAWGEIPQFLQCVQFDETYHLAINEDKDENAVKLLDLLTCNAFNENNENHMELAKEFLVDNTFTF